MSDLIAHKLRLYVDGDLASDHETDPQDLRLRLIHLIADLRPVAPYLLHAAEIVFSLPKGSLDEYGKARA